MIIAIDGPAGAGKSTTARALADRFGFAYIDTGAMYRAIALCAVEQKLDVVHDAAKIGALARALPLHFEENGSRVFIGEREVSELIRSAQVSEKSSQIAALPEVRAAAVEQQRRLGRAGETATGGAVLEGRDIQTVVFPDAEIKIFLDATPETRTGRRLMQWREKVESISLNDARQDITLRDERDSTRAVAPLRAAEDAVVVETDDLTQEQVLNRICRIVEERQKL